MHKMTEIKCKLEDVILEAVENPESVNVEELGAVTDMLKDITMAMYYCHSIEEHEHEEAHSHEHESMSEYINHLGDDITEMIEKASPQDKAALQMKLTALAAKIK